MTGKKEGPLEAIKVSCSPLSNRIQLYRMGRRSHDTALESKDVTIEVMCAVVDHLMATPLKKGVFTATVAGGRRVKYTISVTEEELTDEKEEGCGSADPGRDGAEARKADAAD